MQFGAGLRIPGGEQRDVMTEAHELFGDVRDDALGATIELRRYAFVQGCNLGDAQTRHRRLVSRFRGGTGAIQCGAPELSRWICDRRASPEG
jgi:hypothetical protein